MSVRAAGEKEKKCTTHIRSQNERAKRTIVKMMLLSMIAPVILTGISLNLNEPIVYPAYSGALGVLISLSLKHRP